MVKSGMVTLKFLSAWRYPSRWRLFRNDDRLLLIIIGMLVGVCSGIAAILLNRSLVYCWHFIDHYRHNWWAFLLPAAGAALSCLFLDRVAREGAGHGVPEVIYSVSRYGGLLRLRSSISRLVSSCLTIGSGGSAGPEAPVVMSGASIGSNIAQFFYLNDRQRVTLLGCGAAGAIASIFNAPIAGMVFTMEVILGEWSKVNVVPIAIASVAGCEISRQLQGNQIAFSHRIFHIDLLDTTACIGLAVLTAIFSILLTRSLRGMHEVSDKVPLPRWMRAAVGGSLVGLLGFLIPMVLGEGYHSIRHAIEGGYEKGILLVGVGCLAKLFATTLTLGWGGSGGIFAPCLVIGSFVGLTYHRILVYFWPNVAWVNEGCFALLGMAGMIGGILQAPLTALFLIIEITGGYEVILPLIVVSALSTTLCHYFEPASFYLKDLVEKGQLLRPGTDARVLADMTVQELIEKDYTVIKPNMVLRDFIFLLKKATRNFFPVEDDQTGRFLGMVDVDDVRPYIFNSMMYDMVLLGQLMSTECQTANIDDDVGKILRTMDQNNLACMPVISNGRFVGMISKTTLLDKYRKELMVQTSSS